MHGIGIAVKGAQDVGVQSCRIFPASFSLSFSGRLSTLRCIYVMIRIGEKYQGCFALSGFGVGVGLAKRNIHGD